MIAALSTVLSPLLIIVCPRRFECLNGGIEPSPPNKFIIFDHVGVTVFDKSIPTSCPSTVYTFFTPANNFVGIENIGTNDFVTGSYITEYRFIKYQLTVRDHVSPEK